MTQALAGWEGVIEVKDRNEISMPEPAYSSLDVTTLTGASLRQLQWWDEQGVVTPMQIGHRRLYNAVEVLQVSLIMGLRRKGMSLQKIRRVLGHLSEEKGGHFIDLHREGEDVILLTDGELVHVETSAQQIVEILKESDLPIIALCISDLIRQLEPRRTRRKPVQSETTSMGRRRVSKAS